MEGARAERPGFEGKVALVTGAASGLGLATARALAAAGAKLLLADIDAAGGERAAAELGAPFRQTDVSSLEQNQAAVAAAREEHGGLDLAFLNAGVSTGCGVEQDFDPALYRRAMGTNLDGVVFGAHAALPALRDRGGGSIVATASLAGLTAVPFDPIYAANKHAVVGLARSLGLGLEAEGIRFNAICPGFAESAIIEPIREALAQQGLPIIPAETVAATVLRIFAGEGSGECWFVQPGREPAPFRFPNLPGPRTPADAPAGA
jgi:NAD(P)-dependent dehydrogenase (short-subunit alcohol dehydrogenase family)